MQVSRYSRLQVFYNKQKRSTGCVLKKDVLDYFARLVGIPVLDLFLIKTLCLAMQRH